MTEESIDFVFTDLMFSHYCRTVITLTLVVAVAGFFALRTLHTQGDAKESNWKKAAMGWGIAGATKFTTVLFLPALIVPNFSFDKNQWLKRFLQFFLTALGAYVVVGFPQSFDLAPFGYHLFKQSNNVTAGNFAFMKVWTNLFWEQLQLPLAVVFFSCLLMPERKTWVLSFSESKKAWLMCYCRPQHFIQERLGHLIIGTQCPF